MAYQQLMDFLHNIPQASGAPLGAPLSPLNELPVTFPSPPTFPTFTPMSGIASPAQSVATNGLMEYVRSPTPDDLPPLIADRAPTPYPPLPSPTGWTDTSPMPFLGRSQVLSDTDSEGCDGDDEDEPMVPPIPSPVPPITEAQWAQGYIDPNNAWDRALRDMQAAREVAVTAPPTPASPAITISSTTSTAFSNSAPSTPSEPPAYSENRRTRHIRCFNCGSLGHLRRQCTEPRRRRGQPPVNPRRRDQFIRLHNPLDTPTREAYARFAFHRVKTVMNNLEGTVPMHQNCEVNRLHRHVFNEISAAIRTTEERFYCATQ